ncbi:hemin transporter [Mycetocola tolaasinivorans]|uniref:nitric oxide dioxygenase n=1 Tax=Mycetocola tolaasinivorans TaxID=76635 RepID=A0A3L7AB97_9MICO|nr:globin domain-containing protein [Mycetocola tolaasinivorans]RLP77265.1 hemin transporter [Mycetocola tolaasinivorans]
MLSSTSRPLIEATLPLIAERIEFITPDFYKRMFAAHPELLDGIFNLANQGSGEQPQALAGSIAVFATYLLDNPDTYPEVMLARIAHRHASLGVTADQYDIVYTHLFAAIAADLGDAITPEIAAAWTEVYWLMAHALIRLERDLYATQANNRMWTPWIISERHAAGNAVNITFTPADRTPITPALPGQYVSVKVRLDSGLHQARQFTLTGAGGAERRITSRKRADGAVSPLLQDELPIGSTVELSNPYGDVVLTPGDHPLILVSAGIGSTPSASMLHALRAEGSGRRIIVLHADRAPEVWALRDQMMTDIAHLPGASVHTWLGEGSGEAIDLSRHRIPADAELFVCGPQPFMQRIREQALALGLSAQRVHYEIFGPDVWLPQGA